MLNALEPWHLLIIVGVLVVLFGAKRLPGSARSLGRSMRIFRSEMASGRHGADDEPAATDGATAAASVAPAALAPQQALTHQTPGRQASAPGLAAPVLVSANDRS